MQEMINNTCNNVNESERATYAFNKMMRITYDELGNSIFTYSNIKECSFCIGKTCHLWIRLIKGFINFDSPTPGMSQGEKLRSEKLSFGSVHTYLMVGCGENIE